MLKSHDKNIINMCDEYNISYNIYGGEIFLRIYDLENIFKTRIKKKDELYNYIIFISKKRYVPWKIGLGYFSKFNMGINIRYIDLFDIEDNDNNILAKKILSYKSDLVYIIIDKKIYFYVYDFLKNNEISYIKTHKIVKRGTVSINKKTYIDAKCMSYIIITGLNDSNYLYNIYKYKPIHLLFKDMFFESIKKIYYNDKIYYYMNDILKYVKPYTSYVHIIKEGLLKDSDITYILRKRYLSEETLIKLIKKSCDMFSVTMCKKYNLNHDYINIKNECYIKTTELFNNIKIKTVVANNTEYYRTFDVMNKITSRFNNKNLFPHSSFRFWNEERDWYLDKTELYGNIIQELKEFNDKLSVRTIEKYINIVLNMGFDYSNIIPNVSDVFYAKDKEHLINISMDFKRDLKSLLKFKCVVIEGEVYFVVNKIIFNMFESINQKYNLFIKVFNEKDKKIIKVISLSDFLVYLPRSKSENAFKISSGLGITKHHFNYLENITLPVIEYSFPNIKFEKQYPVREYKLDMCIPSIKVAIECDEYNHRTYNKFKEQKRTNTLLNDGWIILRYIPTQPESIGKVISDLIDIVKPCVQ